MNRTHLGLADDARAFVGDDFYYPAYTCLESFDLGALIGAEPARNKRKIEARNALIVALLLAAWRDPDRWTAYSRDRNYYRAFNHYFGSFISCNNMMWAVDTLESAGLVLHRKTRRSAHARYRSTLRATPDLVRRSPIVSVDQLRKINCALIRLKDKEGILSRFKDTRQTRDWRADVCEQNEVLIGLQIGFQFPDWDVDRHGLLRNGEHVVNPDRNQLYRVFKDDFTRGGRWYGAWWQNLPARDRACLRINNEPVVEIDYRYLHPTLIATMVGRELGDNDPYLLPEFPRPETKLAFNILVNANSAQAAVRALQGELVKLQCEEAGQRAKKLVQAVKAHHADFAFAWGAGFGLRLQCIDAGMCARVQMRMRELGHPVLSVHDSFLVASAHKDLLISVMNEALDLAKCALAKQR